MATYLKRTSKMFDVTSRNWTDVSLRDLMCPVCRGILIEPVSLPCAHNLCLRCLKGTFAHNSLSCPLCRVRVGSWLRTATKSETLVNNQLWQLIRDRFSKEVENKYSGDDDVVAQDAADYVIPNRILSTAGEIRREYETQLQLAQEEFLRQREAERLASEALIMKIQAQEQQEKLAQMEEDKLLAKSLARKQIVIKGKEPLKCNQYQKSQFSNPVYEETTKSSKGKIGNEVEFDVKGLNKHNDLTKNPSCSFTKPKDHYMISKTLNVNKEMCSSVASSSKTKLVKYSPEPGCSNSCKIYGLQSKEELHVPSDVINSKKKTLDIEVCVTTVTEDEGRIGSAESGGSHDSINQEIHHFKPIKAMPRTPLLLNSEGRQIEPKLIRVTPVVKKVSHVSPKLPSPLFSKRVIGCSWSAFKRKWKPESSLTSENVAEVEEPKNLPLNLPNHVKSKVYEDCRLSIDTNKNYTKNINKVVNGVRKIPKGLVPEEAQVEDKSSKICLKSKRKYKRKKKTKAVEEFPTMSSFEPVVENIAERIKRRKVDALFVPEKGVVKNNFKHKDKDKEAKEAEAKKVDSSATVEKSDSDDDVIKQQQRIEQMVLQEKRDFELAMRLQAQFNEMEREPVRTRRSRRVIESAAQSTDSEDDQSPQRKRKRRQTRRIDVT